MYEERILAFIDVLGFSNHIKETIQNDGTECENKTGMINQLLKDIHCTANNWFLSTKYLPPKSKITNQFSDSIIISYLNAGESEIEQIIFDVYLICTMAIQNDFLLRGTVVCDKVYHGKDQIFGPALVKAVNMEKSIAIYPRIILDDSILKDIDINKLPFPELVLKDFDGLYYINYFDKPETGVDIGLNGELRHIMCLYNIINKYYSQKKSKEIADMNVEIKFSWMKEKYNDTINKLKNKYKDFNSQLINIV